MATKPKAAMKSKEDELMELTLQIRNRKDADKNYANFHGDTLIGNQVVPEVGLAGDIESVLGSPNNWSAIGNIVKSVFGLAKSDSRDLAQIAGSLSNYSKTRQKLIDGQVKDKYDKMLHPPLTYLGDAFQYRTADGRFNSAINPHLGQAGAPYAKTVPSKTAPLGALPDPGDLFDKLMARQEGGRQSKSGLSSMLIYHATIIIHDIFRTNENDKNISDSSSYLDLSPLYGYTPEMVEQVRDNKYKLGFLKPDTFAEDRLLRQPPGVCIMLVMYNRYHNYAAAQLRRINENGRFSIPRKYKDTKLESMVRNFHPDENVPKQYDADFERHCKAYNKAWHEFQASGPPDHQKPEDLPQGQVLQGYLQSWGIKPEARKTFEHLYDAAWKKLDDDLFNTARLITCGMYIQISVHDYLRALMGFHQFDTNFTLDPRSDFDQKKTTRGIGNQVTVEFNMLYRFHCAISLKDEKYTEEYMKNVMKIENPRNTDLTTFLKDMRKAKEYQKDVPRTKPWKVTFGLNGDDKQHFTRDPTTGLFNDKKMTDALVAAMDDPISNFGPRNIPKCLRAVEIMGIMQARKWEIGTLNDFRDFFGMSRHKTFADITDNAEIQNALRDLYEHPDKVELYPGIFCESDEFMGLDPGPTKNSYALWVAIFSDAITLVRSDRFYTVDWNTNSLTSWGMKEVTPDNETCKSSVFHRLIQRAFPGWFPYDSVRFFHPFYTAQQNATFARAQNYAAEFKMSKEPDSKGQFTVSASNPSKPEKPVYLADFEKILTVLNDKSDDFMHPVLLNPANLPRKMREVMTRGNTWSDIRLLEDGARKDGKAVDAYLDDLMRSIIKRESISMTNSTYQVDITRDFAIPVITRYVADFLGFGHQLRTEKDLSGHYSENEIYQHITNCQTFLAFNADETKLLKRRKAFRSSMEFLGNLTLHGNISEANSWLITQAFFGRKRDNPMTELGFQTAERILKVEKDPVKAATILLSVGLDFAYNSVLAFTAVLNKFFTELYDAANAKDKSVKSTPAWIEVQKLALSNDPNDRQRLDKIVSQAARTSVRLPIIRTAQKSREFKTKDNEKWEVKEGQRVILDINAAATAAIAAGREDELDALSRKTGLAANHAAYHPKHIAGVTLTTMIKFVAQMRTPRRGHDAQGRVKKINLDAVNEGYANFMPPMRVSRIAQKVKQLPPEQGEKIYTDEVLRPPADTYLTVEWDEMIPFPLTWKIRFDGFGPSDYSWGGKPYGRLEVPLLPDDAPPFYQPRGASHHGGTFGDSAKSTITEVVFINAAELEPTLTTGCALAKH